ncbi:MAG: hypothetical protein COA79_10835 [Planctomycetota bacterium]|nr:MAG: hypothetical protein COA79_10835 [Planctomycetota bacterium]
MRYKWIEISYQEGGEPQTKKFELEDAQYVQFCMDWLDNSIGSLIETIKQETVMNSDELIGRNDPCPCKSGKKYKKCCGKR